MENSRCLVENWCWGDQKGSQVLSNQTKAEMMAAWRTARQGEVGERDAPDAGVPREKPTALDGAFKRVPGSNVGIAAAAD